MIRFFILSIFCFSLFLHADLTPQKYENSPKTHYSFLEFTQKAQFNRNSLKLSAQSNMWRTQMHEQGNRLIAADVRSIYFVHGTFVGNDPIGIIDAIKNVYPDLNPILERELKELAKKNNDLLLKDTGNFLPEYINLFEKAIGDKIPCHAFNWSSGNHHVARLKGAIKLIKTIGKDIQHRSLGGSNRILLLGHSHAGQLFAILTNMLNNSKGTEELLNIISETGEDVKNIRNLLSAIQNVQLDIVTFGTPPRYGWGDRNYRLLNIINHRGDNYQAGSIFGLLVTRDGDYIQQWGIAGTDIPAFTAKNRRLNEQLNSILGTGKNVLVWLKNARAKMRVPQYGETVLVNYQDDSVFLPNAITAFFGHGVYTKYEKMLFNTSLIVKKIY